MIKNTLKSGPRSVSALAKNIARRNLHHLPEAKMQPPHLQIYANKSHTLLPVTFIL